MNRHQAYNKYKRNKEAKQFYNSKAWGGARTLALKRDYYLCQECLKRKSIRVYDVVHHIKPMLLFPKLSFTLDNLVCLCHACHSRMESEVNTRDLSVNVVEVEGNAEII